MTEQDLVNLRRTIYLTIMSSAQVDECAHKLMKLQIRPGTRSVVKRCPARTQQPVRPPPPPEQRPATRLLGAAPWA